MLNIFNHLFANVAHCELFNNVEKLVEFNHKLFSPFFSFLSTVKFFVDGVYVIGLVKFNQFVSQFFMCYLKAFHRGLVGLDARETLLNPTVFRAIFEIFPDVAQRVMDRAGSAFAEADFAVVLRPIFDKIRPARLKAPPRSHKELASDLQKALKTGFLIG